MDPEKRLAAIAAAKKKLNTYKQQQFNQSSESSSSGASGSFPLVPINSPATPILTQNGYNNGSNNGSSPANCPPISLVTNSQVNVPMFEVQQQPTTDVNLKQHSAQPSPAISIASSTTSGLDIVETHHLPNANTSFIFNHGTATVDESTNNSFNNALTSMVVEQSSPDVATFEPPPLFYSNQTLQPTQLEQEQELINRVNLQETNQLFQNLHLNDFATINDMKQQQHSSSSSTSAREHRMEPEATITSNFIDSSYPTPTFRRNNPSGSGPNAFINYNTDNNNPAMLDAASSAIAAEVYELQLSQLRSDNLHLQHRESDLVNQLQNVELTIQSLRRERDELKQELRNDVTPTLKSKLSALYNENAKLREHVQEVQQQLESANAMVKLKVDSYGEMEQALIVINKGKMELAAKLDVESEICKDLKQRFEESLRQVSRLSERNVELESILASHRLQLERLSNLEAEAVLLRKQVANNGHGLIQQSNHHEHQHHGHDHKSKSESDSHEHCTHGHGHDSQNQDNPHSHTPHSRHQSDSTGEDDTGHHQCEHDHDHNDEHDHHEHDHHQHELNLTSSSNEEVHSHDHGHKDGSHSSGHSHSHASHDHDHGTEHDHDHDHEQQHHHDHEDPKSPSAMEKKLARLEWENATFRQELDRLAELLKAKTIDATLMSTYKEENDKLKADLNHAEHVVVQLQGENDTIGDYITLYQSQRLALKASALEKENELASLGIEREKLRNQMEQLNQLLQNYHCKLEEGTAAGEIETNAKEIKDLVLGINSSYHPCSVCEGSRLMNV